MKQILQSFLQETYSNKDKKVYISVLIQSNIIRGKLADISKSLDTITLSDIYHNDKFINITLTIITDVIEGWNIQID